MKYAETQADPIGSERNRFQLLDALQMFHVVMYDTLLYFAKSVELYPPCGTWE